MDGKDIFVGPGRHKALVRAGEHSFIATKPGYLPTNEARDLRPGDVEVVQLALFTEKDKTLRVRRWKAWKPWTVVGSGVAVGLVGGTMHYFSYTNFDEFNARLKTECPTGCTDFPTDQRDRARVQQTVAIV